ncbi:sugar transferase [Sorangium sp. So ce136]|uniref:sugar transferase n=1 Tax=Sorangium sp. So ce136 TaxID=3133284 RepID=UPI003F07A8D2
MTCAPTSFARDETAPPPPLDPSAPIVVEGLDAIGEVLKRTRGREQGVAIASRDLEWLAVRLGLTERTAEGVPIVRFGSGQRGGLDAMATRAIEKLVALSVLLGGAPLWLTIALLISLESPGGAFHVAPRAGLGEKPFSFFKYRTMRTRRRDGEDRSDAARLAVIRGDIPGFLREDGSVIPKHPRDPRITRLGGLLRWLCLDEVPQLIHVLTGDMALVGPRPYPVAEHNALKEWHRLRSDGRPGITGLWQVAARNQVTFDQSVILDIYYLANASFWLDLKIIAITPLRMLFGVGSY